MTPSDATKDFESHLKKLHSTLEETLKHPSSLGQEAQKSLEEGKKSLQEIKKLFSKSLESSVKGSTLLHSGKELLSKAFEGETMDALKRSACEVGQEGEKWVRKYPLSFLVGAFILGLMVGKR